VKTEEPLWGAGTHNYKNLDTYDITFGPVLGGRSLKDTLASAHIWLDYGCGGGQALRQAKEDPRFQHLRLIGVDYDAEEMAVNKAEAPGIEWIVHDMNQGAVDKPHELVTSVFALSYVEDYVQAIASIANNLLIGGEFWLAMFHRDRDQLFLDGECFEAGPALFELLKNHSQGFDIKMDDGCYVIRRTHKGKMDIPYKLIACKRKKIGESITGFFGVAEPHYESI